MYFTLALLNVIGIGTQLLSIAYFDRESREKLDHSAVDLFVQGFYVQFTEFIVRILIPLSLATKNRVAYELTMAGTIVATVNFVYFLVSHANEQLYNYLRLMFGQPPLKPWFINTCRGTIILMLLVSSGILQKRARREFTEMRKN